MSKKHISLFITSTFFVAAATYALLNFQHIYDSIKYYQYTPDTAMAAFVHDTGMNDHGRFLLYASHASLSDAETFNEQCGRPEEATAILGCYDGSKIHIYNITDPRLAGIRPTTAAHEMLHAAYIRLDSREKARIDALLESEYELLKDKEDLKGRMSFYERTQPGDRTNELHSIIGTEIGQISHELETYYARYFSDRSKVVAQHDGYRLVFEELRARAEQLKTDIEQLKGEVENMKYEYESRAVSLQSDISSFNSRADRGDFRDQAEFTRQRQALVAETSALDTLRFDINNRINSYNALIEELNGIVIETNALNRSMDSHVDSAPSL